MFRKLAIPTIAIGLLLTPVQLMAGGPPRLCVPIDGVTAENAAQCAKLLAKSLGDEVDHVAVRQNEKQWYATFNFNREHVSLSDIEAALKGSPFSVPRDKLWLFGHVMLEIDPGKASLDKLVADLKGLKYVSVTESRRKDSLLFVTLAMPYPTYFGRRTADFAKTPISTESFGETFDDSPKVDRPAKVQELPSYAALRSVVEKHNASLKGLRWNCWGCRVLGSVAAEPQNSERKAADAR